MKKILFASMFVFAACALSSQETQLTVYNQNFGVVKEKLSLDLKKGENDVPLSNLASQLEPASVILRDTANPGALKILEQNFEPEPLSQGKLLSKYEGRNLDFEIMEYDEAAKVTKKVIKTAKILRSGNNTNTNAYNLYNQPAYYATSAIVEMEGIIRFSLPGTPLFKSLGEKAFINPTLYWKLWSDEGGKREAELSYITDGISWSATYDVLAPEKGDEMDVVGWVNIDNHCGKDFENTGLKLMAGDPNKLKANANMNNAYGGRAMAMDAVAANSVTQKDFDEYHMYNLPRRVNLLDSEKKQIEFMRVAGVKAKRLYVYDGFKKDARFNGYDNYYMRTQPDLGTSSNRDVWTMMEFKNTKENNLGMPLPRGDVKVYRRDSDGRNEFVGEDKIDHTPENETARIYLGNAFDLVGERKKANFKIDNNRSSCDEDFSIVLRNHKKEKVAVNVVEHLYRSATWEVTESSDIFKKNDSSTIEFRVEVEPEKDRIVTYHVNYTW